jgi:hypothetical protein
MHVLSFVGGRNVKSVVMCLSFPSSQSSHLGSNLAENRPLALTVAARLHVEFRIDPQTRDAVVDYKLCDGKEKSREFFMYFAPSRQRDAAIV